MDFPRFQVVAANSSFCLEKGFQEHCLEVVLPPLSCLMVVKRPLGSPVHLAGSVNVVLQPCSQLLLTGSAD